MIPLQYATPQPPRRDRFIGPLLRFAGGSSLGYGTAIAISKLYFHEADDDECCSLIGISMTIFICCSILRAAAWVREKAGGFVLFERNQFLTLGCGLAMIIVLFTCGDLFDRIFGSPRDGWVILPCLFGLPIVFAWIAFRREAIADRSS